MPRNGSAERAITGHIDFLQVRNGCVHVLDYKPDARTNKPIAQLAIYALALTRLVPGLKLVAGRSSTRSCASLAYEGVPEDMARIESLCGWLSL
jgi:hypothetical protein